MDVNKKAKKRITASVSRKSIGPLGTGSKIRAVKAPTTKVVASRAQNLHIR